MDESAEKKKWITVGVLALVLAVVVWTQFAPAPEVPAAATLAASGPGPGASKPNAVGRAWPKLALTDALQHNPFAPLQRAEAPSEAPPVVEAAALAEAQRQAAADVLEAFQSRRVRAVFITDDGPVALLDTKLVHEGDVVDGVRVLLIRPDGLTVEPADVK